MGQFIRKLIMSPPERGGDMFFPQMSVPLSICLSGFHAVVSAL